MPAQPNFSSAVIVAATDKILTALAKLKASFASAQLTSYEVAQINGAFTTAESLGLMSSANVTEAQRITTALQA